MAQLTRHRTAKFNIQSQRYVDGNNFDFITPDSIKNNSKLLIKYRDHMDNTIKLYNELIYGGIKKEDARFILPNASTCNIIMTIDIRNFRHLIGLRDCKAAQWEIKDLAQEMMKQVEHHLPFASYKVKNCNVTCFDCINERKENNNDINNNKKSNQM